MSAQMINPRPIPEDFGFVAQNSFDSDADGWVVSDGEEAYYQALAKWEEEEKRNEQY